MSHRPRPYTELADDWTFRFEDAPPEIVRLPHSWNALDTVSSDPDFYYRRGTGSYTLDFTPPPPTRPERRLWLTFGAVAQRGRVYFDGDLLAEHHGGYTAFTVEAPDRPGVLRVEANNAPDRDLIPSDLSDFYLYGGIIRPVILEETGAVRIERVLIDSDVTSERASVQVRVSLDGPVTQPLTLTVTLRGPDASQPESVRTLATTQAEQAISLPDVIAPRLWSPDDPALYRVHVTLHDGTRLLDEITTRTGFRWFDFPAGGPFYLNGERLLLKGTQRHDDWAGHASAVPYSLIRQELEQIRAAGFNFLRLGHYPQDDYVLHLCDTLGLIVWEELPWCRGGLGGETFKQHARTMLHEMIDQHYNHPCVIFWGLGNELDWESEHPDSTDETVAAFLRELHEMTRQRDPRRLTALRRFEPGAAIVDVYSPSIWSGWYRGRYEDYAAVLRDAMRRYPRILHIEWGGDSHVGRHNDGPHIGIAPPSELDHAEIPGTATSSEGFTRYSKDGDWSESYIIDLMAHHLAVQAHLPQLAGTAQWVFKDFGTPLRPENPIPYVNQKGLVTRDGTPKDAYYVFQAFQCAAPLVRIESSGWPVRVTGGDGATRIRVITNCAAVELLVDGHSCGVQQRDLSAPAGILVWQMPLTPGNHQFTAVGLRDGVEAVRHQVAQQIVAGDLGPVAGFSVTTSPAEDSGMWLTVQLVDAARRPVTQDERRVRVTGAGVARYLGTPGGSDFVTTANGRAQVRIHTTQPGRIRVEVAGLDAQTITV